MGFQAVLAGVAVNDIDAAIAWYSDFLGRRPDRVPMPNDAEWDFPGGSTLQIFADRERAGSASATLTPDGLTAELERLAAIGHVPLETGSGVFSIAIFADPDGNRLVLAEPNRSAR